MKTKQLLFGLFAIFIFTACSGTESIVDTINDLPDETTDFAEACEATYKGNVAYISGEDEHIVPCQVVVSRLEKNIVKLHFKLANVITIDAVTLSEFDLKVKLHVISLVKPFSYATVESEIYGDSEFSEGGCSGTITPDKEQLVMLVDLTHSVYEDTISLAFGPEEIVEN